MQETALFQGTRIQEIIDGLDGIYTHIEQLQGEWKRADPPQCAQGCGSCCLHFEPDVLESEALYLAAWMMHHQSERAQAILEGTFVSPRPDPESGCFLFDPHNTFHCTVYGGRALICRLFGYTGDRGKDGRPRWKPCRVLGNGTQYSEQELLDAFGTVPPIMSDITAQVQALMPDSGGRRIPLSQALKASIEKLTMLARFCAPDIDPDKPNPDTPRTIAS